MTGKQRAALRAMANTVQPVFQIGKGGIGEAMITTAGGLIVGIPAMFFFFFFRNRLMGIMAELQRSASFLIGVLSGEVKLAGSEPVETPPAE